MVSNLDIYRSANVLVQQHGEDALIEAAMWADSLFDFGQVEAPGLAGARGQILSPIPRGSRWCFHEIDEATC